MAWYWITAIILGYLIIGITVSLICKRTSFMDSWFSDNDPIVLCGAALIWPFFALILIVYIILVHGGMFIQWIDQKMFAKKDE